MKPLRIVVQGLLLVLVVVEGAYLQGARTRIRSLERRVDSFAESGGEGEGVAGTGREAGEAGVDGVRRALAGLLLAAQNRGGGGTAPAAVPSSDPGQEQLRRLVSEQLRALQEQARAAQTQRREDQAARERQQAARELALTDGELARFEELGGPLQEAQDRQTRGDWNPTEAQEQIARLSRQTEQQLQQLLGDDRYRKLDALRREHPELTRSLFVMHPPAYEPPPIASAELPTDGTNNP